MKLSILIVTALLVASPTFAQEGIVQLVRNSRAWDFRTKAGLCAYSNAVVVALHASDPAYGHLAKSEGQNHCVDPLGRNVAVDASLYRLTGQAFDFIGSAGFGEPPPENRVWWGTEDPVGKYSAADWIEPEAGGLPVPPPVGVPPPVVVPPPVTPAPSDLQSAMLIAILDEIKATRADVGAFREDVNHKLRDAMEFIGKYIAPILAGIAAGWKFGPG